MAKKISSSDLFEQEDLFKGVRDSATKTLAVFNELQSEIKATAIGLKNELSANTQASTAQLKQFTAISEEANKLMKQSVEIEKLKAQADQQRIKAEQEIVKLEKLKAQEQARANKEAEKAAKLAQSESSAYSKLSKQLRDAQKAYKDLAVSNQANTQEAKDLLQTITKLDKQLKEVDATVGQHQRNVGNYEGATRNLKLELRQLVRELQNMETTDPRFQEMTQRAGELKDQIQDTQAVVKATAGSAMENLAGSMANAGQIGVAAFQGVEASMALFGVESENIQKSLMRLTALMNLSQSLETFGQLGDKITEIRAGITAFGSKAITAFKGLSTAGKAFATTGIGLIITGLGLVIANWDKLTGKTNANTEAQKKNMEAAKARQEAVSQAQKSAIDSAAKESVEFFKLANALKQTNAGSKERQKIVNQMNAQYGTTLKNLKDEAAFQEQINKAVQDFIKYQNIKIQSQVIEQQLFNITQQRFELETKLQGLNVGNAKTLQNLGKEQKKTNSIIDQSLGAINNQSDALVGLNTQTKLITKNQNEAYNKQGAQTIAQAGKIKDQIGKLDTQFADLATQLMNLQNQMGGFNKKTENSTKLIADYTQRVEKEKIDAMEDGMDKKIALLEYERKYELKEIDKKGKKAGALRTAIEDRYAKEIQKVKDEYRDRSDRDDEIVLEKKVANRIEIGKEEIDAEGYIQSEIARLKSEAAEKEIEKEKETWEKTKEFAQQTTDFFKKQSDERIALIDKEIEAAEKQADIYRELAANGNINAEQSLAEQERIIAESNRRKEREMKRQQRMELANTIYQTYAGHAAQDPKTALANTIRDASLLQAFISTLPMFYEGTEDTGVGGGVDGKGGFHAVLHPHERVIPKSLNDQIGNLTNEQLTQIAQQYRNGNLVRQDIAHSSMDLAVLVNKLDTLTDVIKHKPETNIELGQITQSAMEIVQQSKRGNTVVYNRYKVRK